MANPRKFSEKIALHNQKQAEETAAFERIMREVSDATSKVCVKWSKLLVIRKYSFYFYSNFILTLISMIPIILIPF